MFSGRRKPARFFLLMGTGIAAGGLAVYIARAALTEWAMRSALRQAGASDVRLEVREVSPRRIVVDDVGFQLRRQPVQAQRVTFARDRWWAPTLGKVGIAGLRMSVDVASLKLAAEFPATSAVAAPPSATPPKEIPAEEVSVDGQLVMHASGLEQALTIKAQAKLQAKGRWSGHAEADGPGLTLRVDAGYRLDSQELIFHVPQAHLDLAQWTDFVQRVAPLPPGEWSLAGRFDGTAEGTLTPGRSAATATVKLRGGALSSATQPVSAKGVDADLVFENLLNLKTAPDQKVSVAELHAGGVAMRELEAQFRLQGSDQIDVSSLTLRALGGRITAEPFHVEPSRNEIEATLRAESLSVEELLALAPEVPAKASGRVDGRLPVRIGKGEVRFGTGWFGLAKGVAAEVQFDAKGLLTRGLSTSNPRYAVLSQIEGGLLRLRLGELRLDVHPPDAPAGRSAQLHLAGEPVDPSVKAPVTLDVNVNGPFERLLNLGLDSRVKIGTPKP